MKILFVIKNAFFFGPFADTIRELCHNGHQVKIVHGAGKKPYPIDRPLRALLAEEKRCEQEALLMRRNWRWLILFTRRLLDRTPYLHPEHPSPELVNFKTGLSRNMELLLDTLPIKAALKNRQFHKLLKYVENKIPPDQAIVNYLESYRPDIVVASPCIYYSKEEIEYVKAALDLEIPTIVLVYSWDHLMTKGTFQLTPDWTLVWNRVLADDAVKFHNIPESKVLITGAPHFDTWFRMRPTLNQSDFCRQIGLDPNAPFLAYLCSDVKQEPTFVNKLLDNLARNPETRKINLLVRPYPSKAKIWSNFDAENVVIWPRGGVFPDTSDTKSDYFHTLYHSLAVVGISTTAFLEAALLDKPCVTIMADEFRFEHEMGHFRYLLDADFLEITHSLGEAVTALANISSGLDAMKENRKRFVKEFIRPLGINNVVSEELVRVVESVAQRKPVSEIIRGN